MLLHGSMQQALSVRVQDKAETLLQANGSKYARRIIAKAAVVQDTDDPFGQISHPTVPIQQHESLRAIQRKSHGIDAEIPPEEVIPNAARFDHRQRRWMFIGFAACGGD